MKHQAFNDWKGVLPTEIKTVHVFPKHREQTPKTDYITQFYRQYPLGTGVQWISHSILGYGNLLWVNPTKEIVHQHWIEATTLKGVIGWVWKWFCLRVFLIRGGTLVWTCHNVEPHNLRNQWMNRSINRWMMNHSKMILVHCSGTISRLQHTTKCNTHLPFRIIEHPRYQLKRIDKKVARSTLRDSLELDDNLLNSNSILYFGNIASYKQIEASIDQFLADEAYVFWVVGPVKPDGAQTLEWLSQQAARHPNRFWIHPVHVSDDEAETILAAANVLMFNHRAIEMSGGVALGLSCDKPTVAPAIGCLSKPISKTANGLNFENLHTFTSTKEMVQMVDRICSS